MTSDFKEILSIFNAHAVKYLIVGGYAVMKYSEPRFTKDLDIWVEASQVNSRNVFSARRAFGAPLKGLTEDDFASDGFFQMGRPPVRVDVLMTIDGVEFGDAWSRRQESDFDGIPAHFIGLDDLIKNKTASARPQDLIDIAAIDISRR